MGLGVLMEIEEPQQPSHGAATTLLPEGRAGARHLGGLRMAQICRAGQR